MAMVDTADIHPSVTPIPALWGRGWQVVLYLLRGKHIALIDTGTTETPESAVASALAEQGLALADIDVILNTHAHYDHIGGNSLIQSKGRAKVFVSKDEMPALLYGDRSAQTDVFSALEEVLDNEQFKSDLEDALSWAGDRFVIARTLGNGDVVYLGNGIELEVVSLPGHSPGSIGYYWREHGIMFAGDSVNGRGSAAGGLPIICDSTAYQESIDRLRRMPLKTLCFAHNYFSFQLPPQAIREGSEIKTFLDECAHANSEMLAAAERAVSAEPDASLWRQGERLLEELPAEFQVASLKLVLRNLWPAMGVYSFIWTARRAENIV